MPGETTLNSLKTAAMSGVDVRIMLPHKSDSLLTYWCSRSFVEELLEAGVKVYWYQKGINHSKVIVVDGIVSSVGTANMDIRSFEQNFEVNLILYDREVAKIAGFMHDMGNAINRHRHAEYGALLAEQILSRTDLPLEDRVTVVSAIGNHDESTGGAVDAISAALIIADKTDVRRNRVRNKDKASFDIHDRVNYAVTEASLTVCPEKNLVTLDLQIDENICSMLEYFEIFLERMLMCRRASEMLGAKFKMTANGSKIV